MVKKYKMKKSTKTYCYKFTQTLKIQNIIKILYFFNFSFFNVLKFSAPFNKCYIVRNVIYRKNWRILMVYILINITLQNIQYISPEIEQNFYPHNY